jgi:hypothetical protein
VPFFHFTQDFHCAEINAVYPFKCQVMDSLQFLAMETIVKSALDFEQLARLKTIVGEQEKCLKQQQRNRCHSFFTSPKISLR